jgi:hypothetical protein
VLPAPCLLHPQYPTPNTVPSVPFSLQRPWFSLLQKLAPFEITGKSYARTQERPTPRGAVSRPKSALHFSTTLLL